MKKFIFGLGALLAVCAVVQAAEISLRQVRDPVQLKDWMEANISDVSGVATNIAGASIVSGNIAVARITNAAATVGASIGGNIPQAAITNALATAGALVKGNIPAESLTNAVAATIMPAYASGMFHVVNTTNLAFVAGGVTNIIDEDITTP